MQRRLTTFIHICNIFNDLLLPVSESNCIKRNQNLASLIE